MRETGAQGFRVKRTRTEIRLLLWQRHRGMPDCAGDYAPGVAFGAVSKVL